MQEVRTGKKRGGYFRGMGGVMAGTFLWALGLSVWATESPLVVVRSTVEQAMAVLKDPHYQGREHFRTRLRKLEAIVLPKIDSWEMARRCLGVYWQRINNEQRKNFIRLFTRLIEKSYGNMLDRYPAGVQFYFDREIIDGDFAEVYTRVLSPARDQPFSVTYRLRHKEGKWLLYDVVVENVSMVGSYRSQFHRIIGKSSYEGLVEAIERKLEELEVAPAS